MLPLTALLELTLQVCFSLSQIVLLKLNLFDMVDDFIILILADLFLSIAIFEHRKHPLRFHAM
jgi:hypothetical protein